MIIEEINGVNRSFLMGTKTFVYIHELTGVTKISEVFERLVNKRKKVDGKGNEYFDDQPIECEIKHIDFLSKVFFCLAKTGAGASGFPVDFTEDSASYWLDVIGMERGLWIVNSCVEVYNDMSKKNALAPMEGLKKTA